MVLIHTSDVHSRLLPYQYAPNLPDRNLGLNVLSGVCTDDRTCSSDLSRSCSTDADCAAFPTASVGGIARMAMVIKCERGRAPRTLHLDSAQARQRWQTHFSMRRDAAIEGLQRAGVRVARVATDADPVDALGSLLRGGASILRGEGKVA